MLTMKNSAVQAEDKHIAVALRAAFGISSRFDLAEIVARFKELREDNITPADGLIELGKMVAYLRMKPVRKKPNRTVWPMYIVRDQIHDLLVRYGSTSTWQVIKSIALDNPGWIPKEDVGLTLLYMDLGGELEIDEDGVWAVDGSFIRKEVYVPVDSSIH
ncbi:MULTISPECIES: hypothetical protein [unclassified Acidocella]|uniref:hypothetical protein n=1 Tax=unclassified Acidocella TaxID=2648610 RepID=UPI00028E5ABB|nr:MULTISPECIES: hypothetical protein [unclassified Acidocella]EKM99414.1 hypothetical protein MXAZACID_10503 [Acidocella sp. MX-AZ02]WBO58070.1 hypothetical protein GT370_12445 [Acidocella sp. MX-AZ03]